MIPNRLNLRQTDSPFVTPYDDTNLNSVLSRKQLDENFIYLKGETIYSAETTGNNVILKKLNGNDVTIDLSNFTGGTSTGTTEQDNKFRYVFLGNFTIGGRGVDVSNPAPIFDSKIETYLANTFSLTVNDDELIVILVKGTVYGAFNTIERKYLFPNLLGKGTYNPGDITLDDLELIYENENFNEVIEDGANVTIYPLNNDMEISGLTANCDDFYTLINSGGPYPVGDVDTNYFFRFLCHGVIYIYFYDPITLGLDPDFIGNGYPATNNNDYVLFYNSSLPDIQPETDTIFSGTYETLSTLVDNSQLEIGRKYILTDYQTKYIINGSDSSTRQQVHAMIGASGVYTQFSNVPSSIASNGDVITCVFAPIGATIVTGQTFTIIDYFNAAFIRLSPTVNNLANVGAQFRFEKQRYANIPNNSVIDDINAKPVIKPTGVLNTEVHDGLAYMSMLGSENPTPIVEKIILTAIDVNAFSHNAESLTFVGDTLEYDFNDNIINDDNGNFKANKNGTILKRTNVDDTISTNNDWRVQRYRRYRMDEDNWNNYILKKELSGLSGTSGTTIYKIGAVNYCTSANPTLSLDHRYVVPEPFITNFYTDFAKTSNNVFLSGVTTAPGLGVGERMPTLDHAGEYSNNVSLPLSGFSGTTLAKDFHMIPISSGSPTSITTFFNIQNVSNVVFLTNSQKYGASQNIYVDSRTGSITNSSFMSGVPITNYKSINKLTSLDYMGVINFNKISNVNTFAYGLIENKGLLLNSTIGQGEVGGGVNEYLDYYFSDNSFVIDSIIGSARIDSFMFNSFIANKSIVINAFGLASKFSGNMYLTLYKNLGAVYGSEISINSFVNQIPNKGFFGYIYDFNVQLSDRVVNNFNTNRHLMYQNIDANNITSLVTVSTVQ